MLEAGSSSSGVCIKLHHTWWTQIGDMKLSKRTKIKQILLEQYKSADFLSTEKKTQKKLTNTIDLGTTGQAFPFSHVGHWTLCAAILHTGQRGNQDPK